MPRQSTKPSLASVIDWALDRAHRLDELDSEESSEERGAKPSSSYSPDDEVEKGLRSALDELGIPYTEVMKHYDEPVVIDDEDGASSSVTRAAGTNAPSGESYPPDRLVSLLPRRSASENWTSVSAVLPQDQRLAAFSRAGYRGWLSVVVKIDNNTVARLRALFRKDGRVRIVRVDSGDSIIGVFDADGQNIGELKKANDEALVFLGKDHPTESDLVDHLKIKLSDR